MPAGDVLLGIKGKAPDRTSQANPAVRVTLSKRGNDWLVVDFVPIGSR